LSCLNLNSWKRYLVKILEQNLNIDFYKELGANLAHSNEAQRRFWAQKIVDESLSLKWLSKLLQEDKKTATRFLWLLSDVGVMAPGYLKAELSFLFHYCKTIDAAYLSSFASYWHYVGVPEQNEAEAIELLFKWILSPQSNSTLKSRSMWVLFKLCNKYPDLKNEFKVCLQDQADKHSPDFQKRVSKLLQQLR
jgi:hypothetical protein